MKDIKVVLENLYNQGIALDSAQTLSLKDFIEQDAATKSLNFFLKIIQLVIYIFGVLLVEAKQCYFKLCMIHISPMQANFTLLNLCSLYIKNYPNFQEIAIH